MKKSLKILLVAFLALVVIFVGAGLSFCYHFKSQLRPVAAKGSDEIVVVDKFAVNKGDTFRTVAAELKKAGLIRSEDVFYYATRLPFILGEKEPVVLKTGIYMLDSSMSTSEIILLLASGKQQAFVKVAVPEGLTTRKISAIMEKNEACKAEEFMNAVSSKTLLEKYGIHASSLDGFLYPDTYNFSLGMSAENIVSMMVDNFFDHIEKIPNFAGKKPDEFYNDLILASIVEREYRSAPEAPIMASVFKNRLSINMGLESCATIEYIITEVLGKPHPERIFYNDLKIDSPYNTYKYAGLPPSPISNPGFTALSAVAEPADTDYFYFTLTDSAAGTHTFSKNQREHEKATWAFRTKKAAGQN